MDRRTVGALSSIGIESDIPTSFKVGNKIVNGQIKRSYRFSRHQSEHSRCSFIHDRPLHSGKLHPGYRRHKRATKNGWKATRDTGSPKKRGWARHGSWGPSGCEIASVPIDPRDPNADDTPDNNEAAKAANEANMPLFLPKQSAKQLFNRSSPTELLNRSAGSVGSPKSGSLTISGLRPPLPHTKEIKPPTNTEKEATIIQQIADICDHFIKDNNSDRLIESLKKLNLDLQNASEVVVCLLETIIHEELDEPTSFEILKLMKTLLEEKIVTQYNITQAISNTFAMVAYSDTSDVNDLETAVYRLGHALDFACHNRWISIDDYVVMRGSLEHNAAIYQPIVAHKTLTNPHEKFQFEHDHYSPNQELQSAPRKQDNQEGARLEVDEGETEQEEESLEERESTVSDSYHEESIRKIVLNFFNDAAVDKASDALFNESEEGRLLTSVMIEEAAQRDDVERELSSRLLFELTGNTLDVSEVMAGFNDLLLKLEQSDAKIDRNILAKFIARAVVDEVLPMFFVQHPDIRSHDASIKCLDEAASLLRQEHAAERLYAVWNAEEYSSDLPNEENRGIIDHAKNVISRFGAFVNDQLTNAYQTTVDTITRPDDQQPSNNNQNTNPPDVVQTRISTQLPSSPPSLLKDKPSNQEGGEKEKRGGGVFEEPSPSSHGVPQKSGQENAGIVGSVIGMTSDKPSKLHHWKASKAEFHGSGQEPFGDASKSAQTIAPPEKLKSSNTDYYSASQPKLQKIQKK